MKIFFKAALVVISLVALAIAATAEERKPVLLKPVPTTQKQQLSPVAVSAKVERRPQCASGFKMVNYDKSKGTFGCEPVIPTAAQANCPDGTVYRKVGCGYACGPVIN